MKLSANGLAILMLSCTTIGTCFAADAYAPPTNTYPAAQASPSSYEYSQEEAARYAKALAKMPAPNTSCVLTSQINSDGAAGDAQYRYTVNTSTIYYVCTSNNARKGQKLAGVWTAVNTRGIMPNNSFIYSEESSAPVDATSKTTWVAVIPAKMPPKGWPVGEYKVDLYYKNEIIDTQKFSVTFNTNAW